MKVKQRIKRKTPQAWPNSSKIMGQIRTSERRMLNLILLTLTVTLTPMLAHSAPTHQQNDNNCLVYFSKNCASNRLINAAKLLTPHSLSSALVIEATGLAMELQLPKKFQDTVWPYHYKSTTVQPIKNIFQSSALSPIWQQVAVFTQQLKQEKIGSINANYCFSTLEKKHNQTSATTPQLDLIHAAICASPQFEISTKTLLAHPKIKSLSSDERTHLLTSIYRHQIEQALLETAVGTAEKVIVEIATQPIEAQIQKRIEIIETQLSFGFSELGTQELTQFTTHTDNIMQVLAELDLHKKWAAFIEYARHASTDSNIRDQNTPHIDHLLKSTEHQDFLKAIATRPPALQLRFFRLTTQVFFHSFLSASPNHDLVLAFHTQQWINTWTSHEDNQPFLEGLRMLYLEARISSYTDHYRLILQNRY